MKIGSANTGQPKVAYGTGGSSSFLKKKPMINSWKRHKLCDLVLSYKRNCWKFEHIIRNSMGNETVNILKYEHFLHVNQ